MTPNEKPFCASNGVVIIESGRFLLSDDFEPLWPAAQVALKEYFEQAEIE